MKIENIKVAALVPYARNAKRHDETQVAKIAGSIKEYGFCNPVLIDKDNGIIAGHGRVLAAQKLGLAEVPCIRLVHLTDAQRRAYILADNRLAEIGGGWDLEMLKLELEELDIPLEDIGFSDGFFEDVFTAEEVAPPELRDGDRQPFRQITFTVHDDQFEQVEAAMRKAKSEGGAESTVNENSNGNALAFIAGRFLRG